MAGIGEYIHYNYQAYLQYGTNEPGQKAKNRISADVFKKMYQSNLNKAKSRLGNSGQNKYQELENYLNVIMYPQQHEGRRGDLNDTARMQTIETLVGEEALKFVANWQQGGMTYTSKFSGKIRFTPGTALRIKTTAENLLNAISRSKNVAQATERVNKLKILINQIEQLEKAANISLNSYSGKNSLTQIDIGDNANVRDILGQINNSMATISNASFLQGLGKHFEGFLASVDDSLNNEVENVTVELTNQLLTGTQHTKLETKHSISPKVTYSSPEGAAQMNASGNFNSTYKMDVNLTFNNEQYRISAKNYAMNNQDQRVHLLNGSPFLDILQKNLSIDQANHLINALVAKGKTGMVLSEAQKVAQAIIYLEALAGISQKQGYSDYLIINNRSAKQIKVRPIADLIKPLEQGVMNSLPISIKGYNPQDFTNLNTWVGSGDMKEKGYRVPDIGNAYRRIGNLLNKLKSIKISASLNTHNWNWKI